MVVKVMWGLVAFGALLGLFALVSSFLNSPGLFGGVEHLAGAVKAIAFVAVPYAAARATEELTK